MNDKKHQRKQPPGKLQVGLSNDKIYLIELSSLMYVVAKNDKQARKIVESVIYKTEELLELGLEIVRIKHEKNYVDSKMKNYQCPFTENDDNILSLKEYFHLIAEDKKIVDIMTNANCPKCNATGVHKYWYESDNDISLKCDCGEIWLESIDNE